MREPPKLTDADIRATLRDHYGLSIVGLSFLPIGNDSASFVYRVDAIDGTSYFLKLRTGSGFSPPSLMIPRFLYEQGIPHIVTPLPTAAGTLWVHVRSFALSLYPFIDARTATEVALSNQQWRELGATLHQIHTTQLSADLRQIIPHEAFIPSRRLRAGEYRRYRLCVGQRHALAPRDICEQYVDTALVNTLVHSNHPGREIYCVCYNRHVRHTFGNERSTARDHSLFYPDPLSYNSWLPHAGSSCCSWRYHHHHYGGCDGARCRACEDY